MSDDDELREALGYSPLMRLVALAGHVTSRRFNRQMGRQHGLSSSGAAVLSVLGWESGRGTDEGSPGRVSHAELARRMWLTPATLTGIVDTLEKAGYVRRERDETDRRVVWLVLTGAGRERVTAIGRDDEHLFEPTLAGRDAVTEKVVREFLIDLIVKDYEKE